MNLEAKVKGVSFEILTTETLQRISSTAIYESGYFLDNDELVQHGCLDEALGFSQKRAGCLCPTCHKSWEICPGHIGHLVLALPVFHPAYISQIKQMMNMLCFHCSRVSYNSSCEYCGCQTRLNAKELITPIDCLRVFKNVNKNDQKSWQSIVKFPNMPKDLIIEVLPVSPASIRPSVLQFDGRSNVDSLTTEISKIINYNEELIYKTSTKEVFENWKLMQEEIAAMFGLKLNGDMFSLIEGQFASEPTDNENQIDEIEEEFQQRKNSIKKFKDSKQISILTRLSGKYGRFRSNLSGKRVNFSGRSVISPDPNLLPDELGVPYAVSRILTFPEIVTEYNIEHMKELLDNDEVYKIEKHAAFENVELEKIDRKEEYDWTNYKYIRCYDDETDQLFDTISTRYDTRFTSLENTTKVNALYYFSHVEKQNNDSIIELLQKQSNIIDVRDEAYDEEQQENVYHYLTIPTSTIKEKNRSDLLEPGDVVHRYLQNGDKLLFNREPSLHKASICLFKAKIHPYKTFKFNVVNCANFGADFDGDEMNIMFPESIDAIGEATELIRHEDNIIDIANNELSMNIMQDSISGIYELTRESFLLFEDYQQYLMVDWESLGNQTNYLGDISQLGETAVIKMQTSELNYYESFYSKSNKVFRLTGAIDEPAILFPEPLYTGKELLSKILDNHAMDCGLYIENRDVVIIKNELLNGVITKKILGIIFTELANSDLATFGRESGREKALALEFSLERIAVRYMQKSGFSIGISDVWESDELKKLKIDLIEDSFARLGFTKYSEIEYIWKYPALLKEMRENKDEIPLTTKEKVTESHVLEALSDLRATISEKIENHLYNYVNCYNNPVLIMSKSGSKGSIINQVEMNSLLSQETVNNKMIIKYFGKRVSPHFSISELHEPFEFGFIENCFFSGLNPYEFWFHTTSGREGVIDTAIRTAETGYVERKLSKSLETVTVDWNFNVISDKLIVFNNNEQNGQKIIDCINNSNIVDYTVEELQMILQNLLFDGLHFLTSNYAEGSSERLEDYIEKTHPELEKSMQEVIKALSKSEQFLLAELTDSEFSELEEFIKYKTTYPPLVPYLPIGVLAGMSLGEPTTEMTLKTFHFAGLASRISGIPRLISIINAAKVRTGIFELIPKIASSKKKAGFDDDQYLIQEAKYIEQEIEPLMLSEIAKITELVNSQTVEILIELQRLVLHEMAIDLSAEQIAKQLTEKAKKINADIECSGDIIRISFESSREEMNGAVSGFMEELQTSEVWGFKGVEISIEECETESLLKSERFEFWKQNNRSFGNPFDFSFSEHYYTLYTNSPDNFLDLWNSDLIDPYLSYSSNVKDLENVLGIEAARQLIADEIYNLYKDYGMNVCRFHVDLVASFMTMTGRVLGFTNEGLKEIKKGRTILLASFERTGDYLFDAAIKGTKEYEIKDVSEDLIFGNPFEIGTGAIELFEAE